MPHGGFLDATVNFRSSAAAFHFSSRFVLVQHACMMEGAFTLLIYVLLSVLGICGWLLQDPIPQAVPATLFATHLARDCFEGLHPKSNTTRGKPWPVWTDYVCVIFGALLMYSAYRALGSHVIPSLFVGLCGFLHALAHGRQIIVQDGHYYKFLLPGVCVAPSSR